MSSLNPHQAFLQTIEKESIRLRFEALFSFIQKSFPKLTPVIKWNQPMFVLNETFIIGFSYTSKHIAVAIETKALHHFASDIAKVGYPMSKMLFKVLHTQVIDEALFANIIAYNCQDKANATTFWRKEE